MKHSPGPWTYGGFVIVDQDRRMVARCDRASDVRLIAAAPELLEMLKRVSTFGSNVPVADVEALVARVEGDSSVCPNQPEESK